MMLQATNDRKRIRQAIANATSENVELFGSTCLTTYVGSDRRTVVASLIRGNLTPEQWRVLV